MMKRIASFLSRVAVPLLLFGASIGIAYGFIYLVVLPALERRRERPFTISDILEEVPKEPALYVFVAALVGVYVAWRWWMLGRLRETLRDKAEGNGADGLEARDWNVAEGLRERALALRTRADLILGAGFALLCAGIYLVLFILPEIVATDAIRIERAQFNLRFGNRLECVVKGQCFVKVDQSVLDERDLPTLEQRHDDRKFDAKGVWQISILRFPTTDSEAGGTTTNWTLTPGDRIRDVALSANGMTGIVTGSRGSVLLTTNGGESWAPVYPAQFGDRATDIALSADGMSGIVASRRGPVFLTTDGGNSWSQPSIELSAGEWVIKAGFSADGTTGIVAGDEGSVFLTTDRGDSWSQPSVELNRTEWIVSVGFNADGTTGIVAGDEGSVFLTTDRGTSWTPVNLDLLGNTVTAVAFSADGSTGIVASRQGSVFVTTNGGNSWTPANVDLSEDDGVVNVALSANGSTGIVASDRGAVFVTTNGGNDWTLGKPDMIGQRSAMQAALSADGMTSVVAAISGYVATTVDGGNTWSPTNVELGTPRGEVSAAAQSADGKTGIFASTSGSVYMTIDGGSSWSLQTVELKRGEWVVAADFSKDGTTGIVAGDEGSVFVVTTTKEGTTWSLANMELDSRAGIRKLGFSTEGKVGVVEDDGVGVVEDGEIGVVEDSEGTTLVLKKYPHMEAWSEWSPVFVLRNLNHDPILGKSDLHQEIAAFVGGLTTSSTRGAKGVPGEGEGTISLLFGEINVVRGVTLAVVFFLVQILVRLSQYSLRLASFWDSRADAVLLARSFATGRAVKFDDLVVALAPDAYDFKPTPRSPFDWFRPRRES